jgi:class 3 adenylate cyclase/Tfp pilus assembly protein PilF
LALRIAARRQRPHSTLALIQDWSVFVLLCIGVRGTMAETRKIAAILAADVVGFSGMTSADEDGTLARLRALRSDLIDPTVAAHNGRVFKRTGDGALIVFRSVVDAVRCAIAVQNSVAERFAAVPPDSRIVFRIGVHLGDVVEESDGDLMGDGVNIAARLAGIAEPGAICLSEDAYRQVKARLDLAVIDLGPTRLKNIAESIRVYSLEGGVQRGGNRMQDEIVAPLAGALDAELAAAEARRAVQAPSPDSMDFYFQGLACFNKGMTPRNVAQAKGYFDRALSAEADNTEALIGSARADFLEGVLFFAADPSAALAAAEAKVTRALSSVPDHARGHGLLGLIDIYAKCAAHGIAECERALALDRNYAQAHSTMGWGKIFAGRAEETEAHVTEALRLSPHDAFTWMNYVGVAKNQLGEYEQAVAWHQRSIEANRSFPPVYLWLASALGRIVDAHAAVKSCLALNPTFTISRARALWTAMSDDAKYLTGLEPVFQGMRKAGMPEE